MLAVANLAHHKLNGPDNIVSKDLLLRYGHVERTIALATPNFRPVLLTLPRLVLPNIGYHGNGSYLLLPHQAPEVCDSFL